MIGSMMCCHGTAIFVGDFRHSGEPKSSVYTVCRLTPGLYYGLNAPSRDLFGHISAAYGFGTGNTSGCTLQPPACRRIKTFQARMYDTKSGGLPCQRHLHPSAPSSMPVRRTKESK